MFDISIMNYVYQKKIDELEVINSTYRRMEHILKDIDKYFESHHANTRSTINYMKNECSVFIETDEGFRIEISRKQPLYIQISVYYRSVRVYSILVEHLSGTDTRTFRGSLTMDVKNNDYLCSVLDELVDTVNNSCAQANEEIREESKMVHKKLVGKRVNAMEL